MAITIPRALLLATSIAQEGVSKLLLIQVIQEKSPPGATLSHLFCINRLINIMAN